MGESISLGLLSSRMINWTKGKKQLFVRSPCSGLLKLLRAAGESCAVGDPRILPEVLGGFVHKNGAAHEAEDFAVPLKNADAVEWSHFVKCFSLSDVARLFPRLLLWLLSDCSSSGSLNKLSLLPPSPLSDYEFSEQFHIILMALTTLHANLISELQCYHLNCLYVDC